MFLLLFVWVVLLLLVFIFFRGLFLDVRFGVCTLVGWIRVLFEAFVFVYYANFGGDLEWRVNIIIDLLARSSL